MKILAATDFSEEARPVLDFAANMVRQCGGKMYLLHAVEPCMLDVEARLTADDIAVGLGAIAAVDRECTNSVLAMADNRAKELAESISRQWGIPIYGKAEEADDVTDCVHSFCERHHIDLLVIGNRHHTLLSSLLMGNTAERMMRSAHIPVTVVPCKTPEA